MKCELMVIPPSAQMRLTLSKLGSRRLSLTLKRMASSNAEMMCFLVVERLTPKSPPCTPVFQKGAQIYPKEGQKKSASLLISQNQLSSLYQLKKPARLAQFKVPPPHQTEHQKPYQMCSPCLYMMVVTKEGWMIGALPMLASRKQPVPQVILTSLGPSQCAQADDCWSPKIEQILTPLSTPAWILPISANESTIFGSILAVIPTSPIIYSSHSPFKLHRQVLEALDASVTYSPVRLQSTQVSIVPKRMSPFSATALPTSGTFSISQRILNSEKYVETGRPVLSLNSPCFALNFSQASLHRLSHQTIALQYGLPV